MDRKQVACENPRVLFNRGRIYDIFERGYYHKGVHYYLPHDVREVDEVCDFFSPYKRGLCRYKDIHDKSKGFDISWYRVEDYSTQDLVGHEQPLYFVSECGQCCHCLHKKVMLKAARLSDESLNYERLPLFVTLTYNNDFLPKDGVDKEQVQRFIKRLKHHLGTFRYIVTSEYGKLHNRPHYHMLLYGVHYDERVPSCMERLHKEIQSAWSSDGRSSPLPFGMIDVRPIRDFNGFVYVAKYINKKKCCPIGKNANFVLQSCRPGFGFHLIDNQFRKHFLNNPDKPYVVFNHHTGTVNDFKVQRYYLRKVLPSWNDYYSCDFRHYVDNVRSRLTSYLSSDIQINGVVMSFNVLQPWFNQPLNKSRFYEPLPADDAAVLYDLYKKICKVYDVKTDDEYRKIALSRNKLLDTISRNALSDVTYFIKNERLHSSLLESKIIL